MKPTRAVASLEDFKSGEVALGYELEGAELHVLLSQVECARKPLPLSRFSRSYRRELLDEITRNESTKSGLIIFKKTRKGKEVWLDCQLPIRKGMSEDEIDEIVKNALRCIAGRIESSQREIISVKPTKKHRRERYNNHSLRPALR